MAASKHVREMARAMRDHSREAVKHHAPPAPRYAIIRSLSPISAEITDMRLVLDADDLVLSAWVRQYDSNYGLQVGQTLLVQRMGNGDFVATDVIGEPAQTMWDPTPD